MTKIQNPLPLPLSPVRLCRNKKNNLLSQKGEAVGWAEREVPHTRRVAGLPKGLER